MGSCSLLQGIFPTQGSNPGLPHCRRFLDQLSHRGSPRILEWVPHPFSSRSSRPRNQTRVSPALQMDSLPTELSGKPTVYAWTHFYLFIFGCASSLCHSGFSLVAWSWGYSHCGVLSCCEALALGRSGWAVAPRLWSTGSTDVVHRLRCFEACGIFPGQGSNLGLPRWQADSLPLSHQRSPPTLKKKGIYAFISLAVSGLTCSTWHLHCSTRTGLRAPVCTGFSTSSRAQFPLGT